MDIEEQPITPQKETVFNEAVAAWWKSKGRNAGDIKTSQGGTRDQNLRGDTMDGFRLSIEQYLMDLGVNKDDIFSGTQFSARSGVLPSFFRATKNWDIVICKNSHYKRLRQHPLGSDEPELVAVIEFKSQDKSIGNNQNNRIEESVGSAEDFWAAYEAKHFLRLQPRPWLGYLFVGVYTPEDAQLEVEIRQPHFPVDPVFAGKHKETYRNHVKFKGLSYAHRYGVFLERLIAKKKYDAASFIVTNEQLANENPNYDILFPEFSGAAFLEQLGRHIKGYYF